MLKSVSPTHQRHHLRSRSTANFHQTVVLHRVKRFRSGVLLITRNKPERRHPGFSRDEPVADHLQLQPDVVILHHNLMTEPRQPEPVLPRLLVLPLTLVVRRHPLVLVGGALLAERGGERVHHVVRRRELVRVVAALP